MTGKNLKERARNAKNKAKKKAEKAKNKAKEAKAKAKELKNKAEDMAENFAEKIDALDGLTEESDMSSDKALFLAEKREAQEAERIKAEASALADEAGSQGEDKIVSTGLSIIGM